VFGLPPALVVCFWVVVGGAVQWAPLGLGAFFQRTAGVLVVRDSEGFFVRSARLARVFSSACGGLLSVKEWAHLYACV